MQPELDNCIKHNTALCRCTQVMPTNRLRVVRTLLQRRVPAVEQTATGLPSPLITLMHVHSRIHMHENNTPTFLDSCFSGSAAGLGGPAGAAGCASGSAVAEMQHKCKWQYAGWSSWVQRTHENSCRCTNTSCPCTHTTAPAETAPAYKTGEPEPHTCMLRSPCRATQVSTAPTKKHTPTFMLLLLRLIVVIIVSNLQAQLALYVHLLQSDNQAGSQSNTMSVIAVCRPCAGGGSSSSNCNCVCAQGHTHWAAGCTCT